MPQKGIVHYGLSNNRMRPLAGAWNAAIFNTFRRTRNQILYWAVPVVIAYEVMQWAIERWVTHPFISPDRSNMRVMLG